VATAQPLDARSDTGAVVQAVGLVKIYGEGEAAVHALRGVDLEIPRGQFAAIMGPSGSGKSTLLHLLGGLDIPTSGEVRVADTPLSRLSDRDLTLLRRDRMGFIFQFFNLLPTLTAEENVALPLMLAGRSPGRYADRVVQMLELVGLGGRRRHLPQELSGGEQQRVAVARALVTSPDIVLADEPTGNLDTIAGGQVLELMRRSATDLGQTIVMVSHDPGAASVADRVVFMRDGRLVHEELGASTEQLIDVIKSLEARGTT
jgi:putative ABC transport system ATP-binding protein